MLRKITRLIGQLIIFAFASFSIAVFQFEREIDESNLQPFIKKLLTYPAYFENIFYDYRFSATLDDDALEKRIILGAIDEKSLKRFGRFPWPRTTWVKVIEAFENFGVKIISFDVIFSEPERFLTGISPDVQFANAIKEFQKDPAKKIIIPYSLSSTLEAEDDLSFSEVPGILFNNMLETTQLSDANLHQKRVMKTTFPISEILKAKPILGFIGIKEDKDGVFRRYPLTTNVDMLNFPSQALASYMHYTGDIPKLHIAENGDASLKLKTGTIHLNPEGETKINWLGDVSAFQTVSLQEVVDADPNDEKLKKLLDGNMVFIGSTSFAAHDLRHSPVNAKMPGIYFHMNVTQMLMSGRFYQPADQTFLWSWAILIIGTILTALICLFQNALVDAIFVIIFCTGTYLLDAFKLLPEGYEITMFFSMLPIVALYIWNTGVNFWFATQDKQFLKQAFGNYISSELIDEMYDSGHLPELGGQVDVLTAYFTDIQTFSSFSELLTPKELVELLNEYLTEMTNILIDCRGTLDKYEGDAIIAFFGAPVKLEDHAKRACRVAIQMQEALGRLRKKWISEGDRWPPIVHNMRMRIGINSGDILTGNMGCQDRMNYTMMGDSVNLAARLEECAKQYGVYTQISQFTKELTNNDFIMRELDTMRVVGKKEPVTTYELLGETGKTDQLLLNLQEGFNKGLALYKERKWKEAMTEFNNILELEYKRYPDYPGIEERSNPSKVYIERCEHFIETPPPEDWDGVYTLTEK